MIYGSHVLYVTRISKLYIVVKQNNFVLLIHKNRIMKKDFITATPDTGSGNGTVNVKADKNTGGSRSTFITITGGGVTRTIPISQEAAPIDIIVVGAGGNIIKTTIT